jgi:nicotinate-nucleotide adenylyltransferase
MRIGVLGGTFDPPHLGHLILGEQARDQLDLDRVLWVPAAVPPHKQAQSVTSTDHRLAMVQLAINDNDAFELSRVDLDRPGPHFTADMLQILRDLHAKSELHFLLGGDSLRDLLTWREPQRIIQSASLVVMERPHTEYDLQALEAEIQGIAKKVITITTPLIEIAGSDLRQRVLRGNSIRYLVPSRVCDYITHHHLYQSSVME